MAYIYSLADTWNASGTTFTGIGLNVTDTASAAGSLLMDLQVGGVSQFSVRKDGAISVKDAQFIGTGISMTGGSGVTGMALISTYTLGWVSNTTQSFTTPDLRLARDAANTLGQRNGVNAQAFNLYNTYTDASNYERGFMRYVSNELRIGHEAAGTGSSRGMSITGGVYINLNIGAVNKFGVGGSTNLSYQPLVMQGYIEFPEQVAPAAPATNNVRIYAEDDGAGKTRLMARFATGAAVQIAIEP